MRTILTILLIATLASCVTQKRCNQKFPPQISITEKGSVRDSIVYEKDTVYVPGAQVNFTDTIPCPEFEYERKVATGKLTTSVKISKGKLTVDCKADSLQLEVDKLKHFIIKEKSTFKNSVHNIVEYKTRWYDYISRGLAFIFLIIILLFAYKYIIR